MYVLTPPTLEVVTLAELKLSTRRTDSTDFDAQMLAQAASALAMAEQYCRRAFAQQVWRFEMTDWTGLDDGLHAPAASAVAISYWSSAGTWQMLSSPAPVWWQDGAALGLAPALASSWPELGTVAGGPRVRVDVTVGASSAANVPRGVKDWILAHVGLWADRPEAASDKAQEPAPWLHALLDPYRAF